MFKSRKKHRLFLAFIIVIIIILALGLFKAITMSNKPQISLNIPNSYKVAGNLEIKWPYDTQGSVMIDNYGIVSQTNRQQPIPLASLAKIMTAYLILKDHPLHIGQNGPIINITENDVKTYINDKKNQQSVLKVTKNEKLSEKQLLEGLLLPSGNNCATILAKWDSGSTKVFVEKMNKTAKQLGMNHTHYADPAGVRLYTVSTANDQLKLAQKVMKIPEFRYIVSKPQVTLPVAGTVYNVNYDLGKDGIIGIKTGSMPQSGGNFVFASKHDLKWKHVLIIGALLGEYGRKPLMDALKSSIKVINQVKHNMHLSQIFKKEGTIGYAKFVWLKPIPLVIGKSLYTITWPGVGYNIKFKKNHIKLPIKKNEVVGYLDLYNKFLDKKIPVLIENAVKKPTFIERLKSILTI
ncbi:D-alanyl-D-alanine carboxypeptidase [Desulfurella amilsii]|uniref:D-alanyl-D-alanine carboxypeptidase n=1 Tax=Desulfurella amilsii TaxID=1562698 RepID=A0A1X4XY36_9BACT|nr:D-alanyl-D-alanine carboxypeptidase [Desulfurella amilsii]OSS42424.1 D-alanyl-D-alanine carboxypeptidase [Desulfurella amilsii]